MEKTNSRGVVDLVANDARFTKFGEVIKAAGLDEKFANAKDLTVFAPTNSAFAKLPQDKVVNLLKTENREQLRKLVLLHAYAGKLMAEDLQKVSALKTEAGQEIKVTVSRDLKDIALANAKVMLPKEEANNGVVYPLDAVLQPANTTAVAA